VSILIQSLQPCAASVSPPRRELPTLPHFIVNELETSLDFYPPSSTAPENQFPDIVALLIGRSLSPTPSRCSPETSPSPVRETVSIRPVRSTYQRRPPQLGRFSFQVFLQCPDELFVNSPTSLPRRSRALASLLASGSTKRSNDFGMRLRNLNDNRAAARVSNKVYLPEIQFLDQLVTSWACCSMEKSVPIHAALRVKCLRLTANDPVRRTKNAELRVPNA